MPIKVTRPPPKAKQPHKPQFPIRKPALVKAGDAVVAPINTGKVRAHYVGAAGFHGWIFAQYAAVAVLLLTAIAGGLWIRKTLILAEVGRSVCGTLSVADTPEGQIYWLEPDPGSDVPEFKGRMVGACYEAARW